MPNSTQRLRRDALPEHTSYADRGCELHSACLTCPLEECKFDRPGGASAILRHRRNEALVEAAMRDGVSARDLATMFGLSRRTVFRVLRQARTGGHAGRSG